MLRPGTPLDLPRLLQIRDAAGADALSDPELAATAELTRLIATGAVLLWDEGGEVAGFAAVDTRDGTIRALLVDAEQRSRGIGRELLAAACAALRDAGCPVARLSLSAGSATERHYLGVGWTRRGDGEAGAIVLQKPL